MKTRRLLIVCDGALQYVPFGALPAPKGMASGQWPVDSGGRVENGSQNQNLSTDHRPLITDHEIISLPSASTLAVLRRELAGRSPASKIIAVLADPVFSRHDRRVRQRLAHTRRTTDGDTLPSADDDQLRTAAEEVGLLRFNRLYHSREEAESIAALVPQGKRLMALDFDANRTTALSQAVRQCRIVHLAAHGLLNSQHPGLSGLVLSLVDERGQSQNGFLRLHNIYNLRLNAELVVLSACQTALGKDIRGEGLIGLTRGFMYAGAPRVVASLWNVEDRATARLMELFYRGMLKKGLKPAAALRQAQMAMWQGERERWRHPFYWAGFVLQGEWR